MKFVLKLLAAAAAALALEIGSASETATLATADSDANSKLANFTHDQILEAWGWFAAWDKEVAEAELNSNELAVFARGWNAGLRGRQPPLDLRKASSDLERMSLARRRGYWQKVEQKNVAAGRTFMEGLSEKKLVEIGGGVKLEYLRNGTGPFAKPEQTVNLHYVGRLVDGSDFTELGPYDLVLVKNRLLPALFDGVQKMNRGSVVRLYVPPILPGVDENRPGVPRGALTIYEVELFDIKPTSAEDLENSLLPPAPEPLPPPPSGATDEQIIEAWGWATARKTGVSELGLSEKELALLTAGTMAGIKGDPCPFPLNQIRPVVDKYISERRQDARVALLKTRAEEMKSYLDNLEKEPKVNICPDGLRFQILNAGTEPRPKTGQVVLVEYTGRLIDGTIFDQTYNEPLHIEIGSVIPGLNEGLQQIGKGGKIKLYVPPSIGYGDEDVSGVVSRIPAGSLLIYDLVLLDILDAPKKSD